MQKASEWKSKSLILKYKFVFLIALLTIPKQPFADNQTTSFAQAV